MYCIGDCIAHPLHGAGIIERIESKKINGMLREYYVVKIPVGNMIVMIPKETSDSIGVRPIVGAQEADSIIAAIAQLEVNMTQNWNRRYRENMMRIKSGDLMEVAAVIRAWPVERRIRASPQESGRCSTRQNRFSSRKSYSVSA